jgi:hypothetical protein
VPCGTETVESWLHRFGWEAAWLWKRRGRLVEATVGGEVVGSREGRARLSGGVVLLTK